ncbi:WYL domain-containing protein [Microbacteriaceae bacterium VKM Ac-2854]|nr:WYL domain-containing protein [Microbacteriaceae bacterium VKM Ac-2854]
MPSSRIPAEERLFSLVLALIAAENGLTKTEILATVQGYRQRGDTGAARTATERQFERDKDDLRELGIPVETVDAPGDPGNTQTARYRIAKGDYDLPADISFSSDEVQLLRLAGAVWREGTLSAQSRRALIKLRSIGVESQDPVIGLAPRIRVRDAAFEPLGDALDRSNVVRFPYLKPGDAAPRIRTIEPRALVHHQGRWHLHGWDRDAAATRTFLLARIVGPVVITALTFTPDGRDHSAIALAELDEILARTVALLRVRPESDAALRLARRAGAVAAAEGLIELHYTDPEILADELAGYGPEVLVIAPSALADRVRARLRRILADHVAPALESGGADA